MFISFGSQSASIYGSHTAITVASQYLSFGTADYGSAFREITGTIYFDGRGERCPAVPSRLEELHTKVFPRLPSVRLLRKRSSITIDYKSEIASATFLETFGLPEVGVFGGLLMELAGRLALLRDSLKPSDDFNADRFLRDVDRLVAERPTSAAALRELNQRLAVAEAQRQSLLPWDEQLGIRWASYHPAARSLLDDPFFWSESNELSPHGNDTGSDLLAAFRRWNRSQPRSPAIGFARRLIGQWGLPVLELKVLSKLEASAFAERERADLRLNVQASIAAAFAAIKLRGACDQQTRDDAGAAISLLPLLFRDQPSPDDRLEIELLAAALAKAPLPSQATPLQGHRADDA